MYKEQLVSILIPNYNKAAYLRETLDSVLCQTYQNWECVVVDDHSTDNSWNILQEYATKDKRFKIIRRPNNLPKGGNVCRNYAFENSKGEFIQWFDSDDLMSPFMLDNRILELQSNPKSDFSVFSGCNFYKFLGDESKVFSWVFHKGEILESFLSLDPPWLSQSCLYRKKFLHTNDIYWDPELKILQDVVYNLIAFCSTDSIGYSKSDIDWFWRWHSDGHNVGAKRSDPMVFSSYNQLFKYFKKLVSDRNPELNKFISSAAYEISLACRDQYSWVFFKNLVVIFYRIRLFNFPILLKHSFYFIIYTLGSLINGEENNALKKRAMTSLLSNLNSEIYKQKFKNDLNLNAFKNLLLTYS